MSPTRNLPYNPTMPLRKLLATTLLLAASLTLHAQSAINPAITTDPAPDKTAPAAIETFQLPSHGALLNALVYTAAGANPHPTVLLLHGFPGNERNLDLAQTLRRAGYNVLFFDYRGSWGSPGDFSFTHAIEDTHAAIAYLRDPANATRLHIDPAHLILIGHSMGGFLALNVAAQDPAIATVVSISAALPGVTRILSLPPGQRELSLQRSTALIRFSGLAPLNGCPPATCAESLAKEAIANAAHWDFAALAPELAPRPLLLITSDDGLAPASEALATKLNQLSNSHTTTLHLPTDHSYSDHRIALQQAVLNFLATLNK